MPLGARALTVDATARGDARSQLLDEEITPKLDKLRKERTLYHEFQKTKNELERIQKFCLAYQYTALKVSAHLHIALVHPRHSHAARAPLSSFVRALSPSWTARRRTWWPRSSASRCWRRRPPPCGPRSRRPRPSSSASAPSAKRSAAPLFSRPPRRLNTGCPNAHTLLLPPPYFRKRRGCSTGSTSAWASCPRTSSAPRRRPTSRPSPSPRRSA